MCRHSPGCQRFTSLGQLSPQIPDVLVSSAEKASFVRSSRVPPRPDPKPRELPAVRLPLPSVEGLLPYSSLGLLEEHLEERREGEVIRPATAFLGGAGHRRDADVVVLSSLAGSLHRRGHSHAISASLCTYQMASYITITLLKYL